MTLFICFVGYQVYVQLWSPQFHKQKHKNTICFKLFTVGSSKKVVSHWCFLAFSPLRRPTLWYWLQCWQVNCNLHNMLQCDIVSSHFLISYVNIHPLCFCCCCWRLIQWFFHKITCFFFKLIQIFGGWSLVGYWLKLTSKIDRPYWSLLSRVWLKSMLAMEDNVKKETKSGSWVISLTKN